MSSINKTKNLGLNNWIGSDRSQREDFSKDNEIIDEFADKVLKMFEDCLKKSNLVNNCSTTEEGFAADARIAKKINDKIDSLFNNSDNYFSDASSLPYGISFLNPEENSGSPFAFWSTVLTVGRKAVSGYKQQLAFPWDANISDHNLAYRTSDSNNFGAWYKIPLIKNAIADVGKKNISFAGTGNCNYFIKNGFCTVEFKDIQGQGTNVVIAETSELPYPVFQKDARLENNGNTIGTIFVSGNGKITCHKTSSELGYGTMLYQVDESRY